MVAGKSTLLKLILRESHLAAERYSKYKYKRTIFKQWDKIGYVHSNKQQ